MSEIVLHNLKTARIKLNLNQDEVAERAGLHVSQISNIERGQVVTIKTAHKIADALGFDVFKLMSQDKEVIINADSRPVGTNQSESPADDSSGDSESFS